VIPAKALAKVSMRLVPNMTSAATYEKYAAYVQQIAPRGVTVETRLIHSGEPVVIGTDNPFVQKAVNAMHEIWKQDTVFVRGGGSIPIVGEFERHLKTPVILMGFGLPDDNLHAPNEKFHIANFYRGIDSIILFLESCGA
jgi:acetylornithine deacetylase/succinyl-diaminopimelate desuccinylase-like protein